MNRTIKLHLPARLTAPVSTAMEYIQTNYFHGIVESVGAPLVGARKMEQSSTMGQPQRIAPTVGDVVGV